jgi:sugar-specific transcriptional regulator TrmB
MVKVRSSPFGGSTRTRVLLALQRMDESYARELARLLGVGLASVQSALRGLERDGLVAARAAGRTRVYRLDPRYFAYDELRRYLARLAEPEREIEAAIAALRRRPRRSGKPL